MLKELPTGRPHDMGWGAQTTQDRQPNRGGKGGRGRRGSASNSARRLAGPARNDPQWTRIRTMPHGNTRQNPENCVSLSPVVRGGRPAWARGDRRGHGRELASRLRVRVVMNEIDHTRSPLHECLSSAGRSALRLQPKRAVAKTGCRRSARQDRSGPQS